MIEGIPVALPSVRPEIKGIDTIGHGQVDVFARIETIALPWSFDT
jgi:hypothetical protein